MRKGFLFSVFIFPLSMLAQIGGANFSFLNQVTDARSLSLGGMPMLAWDVDASKGLWNPALLNPEMNAQAGANILNYLSNATLGSVYYIKDYEDIGTFALSMQSADYGTMDGYDISGRPDGEFQPGEVSLNLGASRKLNERFQVGAQLKLVYSSLGSYNASAIFFDFSSVYTSESERMLMSLIVRNVGGIVSNYTPESTTDIPLEVHFSLSHKLEHMPMRWLLNVEQLQDPDLSYNDPNLVEVNSIDNTTTVEEVSFSDKALRHISLGTELLISKNFHFRFGYNYRLRQELGLKDFKRGVGLSWGFSMRLSKFKLQYGRATYHAAGALNSFSIAVDINEFGKKL